MRSNQLFLIGGLIKIYSKQLVPIRESLGNWVDIGCSLLIKSKVSDPARVLEPSNVVILSVQSCFVCVMLLSYELFVSDSR